MKYDRLWSLVVEPFLALENLMIAWLPQTSRSRVGDVKSEDVEKGVTESDRHIMVIV